MNNKHYPNAHQRRTTLQNLYPQHPSKSKRFIGAPTCCCVFQVLVEKGAKVNVTDEVGYTPLHIAANNGHYQAAKSLIHHKSIIDFMADDKNIPEVCKAIAELSMNPLNLAIENNHPEVAELLLQNGAQANQQYFLGHEINLVPLDNIRCLEVLLKYGANPDVYSRAGLTTLMKAAKEGNVEAVKLLIQYGADTNMCCGPRIDQKRAIYYAILGGNLKVTYALLEGGAYTSKPPDFKYPPLEYAITQDKLKIAKLLLDFGADANECNDDGCTSLQIVCSMPNIALQKEAIDLLLLYGADPNFTSQTYSYVGPSLVPLVEYLAHFGDYDLEIIQLLLKYGAEVNFTPATKFFKIKDSCGMLYQAKKMKRQLQVQELLLEASGCFSKEGILCDKSGLSKEQSRFLLEQSDIPRSLMHQARLSIRRSINCSKPPKIMSLPIPVYLKNYLLYQV